MVRSSIFQHQQQQQHENDNDDRTYSRRRRYYANNNRSNNINNNLNNRRRRNHRHLLFWITIGSFFFVLHFAFFFVFIFIHHHSNDEGRELLSLFHHPIIMAATNTAQQQETAGAAAAAAAAIIRSSRRQEEEEEEAGASSSSSSSSFGSIAIAGIHHVTIVVSNLTESVLWYTRAIPGLVPIERKEQTVMNGAWFQFQNNCGSTGSTSLCHLQIHLLQEEKRFDSYNHRHNNHHHHVITKSRISGQHIGLDIGSSVSLGKIRQRLYENGIPCTLSPEKENVLVVTTNNNMSSSSSSTSTATPTTITTTTAAIFVLDPDRTTWEFTHSSTTTTSHHEGGSSSSSGITTASTSSSSSSEIHQHQLLLRRWESTLSASETGIQVNPKHESATTGTTEANTTTTTTNSSTTTEDDEEDAEEEEKEGKKKTPHKFAISTGNPLATAAGYAVLQAGGSAADAAVAASAVMSVVEPYNGGLGGDYMALVSEPNIHYDVIAGAGGSSSNGTHTNNNNVKKKKENVWVLNGSGRAPKNAKSLSYLKHRLWNENEPVVPKRGPLSALTVPGAAAAWCKLHSGYGRLPWDVVLMPAIMMASEGFVVSNRTAQVWEQGAWDVVYGLGKDRLTDQSKIEFMQMFAPGYGGSTNGEERMTPRAGERFYNPTLGTTLGNLAKHGCEWFYSYAANKIAEHLEERGGLGTAPESPAGWNEKPSDHASWETPLEATYTKKWMGKDRQKKEDKYRIFSAGENSQGGTALMILKVLNRFQFGKQRDRATHSHISAKRLVYARKFRKALKQQDVDNDAFINAASVEVAAALYKRSAVPVNGDVVEESHDTEGLVVRDATGLSLSVLQSIALPFGSGVVVPSLGIPIHGRGYGFTTEITRPNMPKADDDDSLMYSPGARPWTTLSPYMVLRENRFWMAASVKGGDRQPYAFTQIFLNMIELGQSAVDAVSMPRFRDSPPSPGCETTSTCNPAVEFDEPPYQPSNMNDASTSGTMDLITKISSQGYSAKIFAPSVIEDSGFGVAQLIIDHSENRPRDPAGAAEATTLEAVTDLRRKTGLALARAQASLVSPSPVTIEDIPAATTIINERDMKMITEPITRFLEVRSRDITKEELERLRDEGTSENDLKKESSSMQFVVPKEGAWRIFKKEQKKLLESTNVHLSRNGLSFLERIQWRDPDSLAKIDAVVVFDEYQALSRSPVKFPVGPLPVLSADPYILSLSEDNPRFDFLLRSMGLAEHLPAIIDSRDAGFQEHVYYPLRELRNEGNEGTLDDTHHDSMSFLNHRGLDFPIVVKQSEGTTAGVGVKIVANLAELSTEMTNRFESGSNFILQQALKGDSEYTLHFMAHYGRLLSVECFMSSFNDKDSESVYVKGYAAEQPSNKGRGFMGCQNEAKALKVVQKVAAGLLYNGFGCLQYKKDRQNGDRVMIIELNPRMCAGLGKAGYWHKPARMAANWMHQHQESSAY